MGCNYTPQLHGPPTQASPAYQAHQDQSKPGHCLRVSPSADEHIPKAGHRPHSVGVRLWPTELRGVCLVSERTPHPHPCPHTPQLAVRVKVFLVHLVQGTEEMQLPISPCADGAGLHSFLFNLQIWRLRESVGTRAARGGLGTLPAHSVCATRSLPRASLCPVWNKREQECPDLSWQGMAS